MKLSYWSVCVLVALTLGGMLALPERVSAQASDAAPFTVSELKFERPGSWQTVRPRSSMRKAQFSVPNAKGGEAAEVVFFHFGRGNAGGTQANIDRWFRQFQEPKAQLNARTEEAKAGGIPVTFVHAEGTFMSGPPVGRKVPKAGFALLGAIVEAEQGFIFVKMTGPKAVIAGAEADFKTMVTSAK